mmetsp:Transcript_1828/g.4950  ORF Transcript_1828/g.4950 Transcript_1828/m.4950 type:complete len:299 (+) Transcript_1828:1089-1985(+)
MSKYRKKVQPGAPSHDTRFLKNFFIFPSLPTFMFCTPVTTSPESSSAVFFATGGTGFESLRVGSNADELLWFSSFASFRGLSIMLCLPPSPLADPGCLGENKAPTFLKLCLILKFPVLENFSSSTLGSSCACSGVGTPAPVLTAGGLARPPGWGGRALDPGAGGFRGDTVSAGALASSLVGLAGGSSAGESVVVAAAVMKFWASAEVGAASAAGVPAVAAAASASASSCSLTALGGLTPLGSLLSVVRLDRLFDLSRMLPLAPARLLERARAALFERDREADALRPSPPYLPDFRSRR